MKENVKTVGVHHQLPSLQALHESKLLIVKQMLDIYFTLWLMQNFLVQTEQVQQLNMMLISLENKWGHATANSNATGGHQPFEENDMDYKERFIPGQDQWQVPLPATKLRSSFLIVICCRKST
jgi:hypothetical protein